LYLFFQSSLELFNFGGKKSAPKAAAPKKAAPAAKKAAAAPKKAAKDMTWGGRPDPTPESFVGTGEDFFSASWRFNRPVKK
jgi:hypothetical protein